MPAALALVRCTTPPQPIPRRRHLREPAGRLGLALAVAAPRASRVILIMWRRDIRFMVFREKFRQGEVPLQTAWKGPFCVGS